VKKEQLFSFEDHSVLSDKTLTHIYTYSSRRVSKSRFILEEHRCNISCFFFLIFSCLREASSSSESSRSSLVVFSSQRRTFHPVSAAFGFFFVWSVLLECVCVVALSTAFSVSFLA
jgi:hypothetical protein